MNLQIVSPSAVSLTTDPKHSLIYLVLGSSCPALLAAVTSPPLGGSMWLVSWSHGGVGAPILFWNHRTHGAQVFVSEDVSKPMKDHSPRLSLLIDIPLLSLCTYMYMCVCLHTKILSHCEPPAPPCTAQQNSDFLFTHITINRNVTWILPIVLEYSPVSFPNLPASTKWGQGHMSAFPVNGVTRCGPYIGFWIGICFLLHHCSLKSKSYGIFSFSPKPDIVWH